MRRALVRPRAGATAEQKVLPAAAPWLALIGLPIGFASSLCGIGGGLFAGSLLYYGLHLDIRRAAGTSLVLVVGTTLAATVVELDRDVPSLDLWLWLAVVAGVWLGAKLGFRLSEHMNERTLRGVFSVVFLFAAARVVLHPGGTVGPGLGGVLPGSVYLHAGLVGLLGGTLSPMLGIGGGIVMVPGLFLFVPGIHFDAARATSLAAALVGSSRSLLLKARAGRVAWRHGLYLGGGAVVGSALGVLSLEHLAVLRGVGRHLLGLILVAVGLRFAKSWWTERRPRAASPSEG